MDWVGVWQAAAAGEMIVTAARLAGLGGQVTGKAVLPECLHSRVGFRQRVKGSQAGDAAGALAVLDGGCTQAGSQVGLRAEGIADAGDRARIGGLDAGGGALDMVIVSSPQNRCDSSSRRRRPAPPRNPPGSCRRAYCYAQGLHPVPGVRRHGRSRSRRF